MGKNVDRYYFERDFGEGWAVYDREAFGSTEGIATTTTEELARILVKALNAADVRQ